MKQEFANPRKKTAAIDPDPDIIGGTNAVSFLSACPQLELYICTLSFFTATIMGMVFAPECGLGVCMRACVRA